MNRSLVAAIVESAYPQRRRTAVEPIAAGRRSTAVVRFATGAPLVVQLSEDAEAVRTEAALVAAVRSRTAVPVPEIRATGSRDGRAYTISEYLSGTDLHTTFANSDADRQRAIARQFGRYLGELHAAFPFDGCGDLERPAAVPESGADALVPSGTDCRRFLVEYGLAAINRLPSEFEPLREGLVDCLRDAPADAATRPRLFPWDLRPGNALVEDGRIAAVVDWERPMAAPPALALAKTTYLVADWYVDEPAPLRAALREGYGRVRPVPSLEPVHRVVAVADTAVDSRGAVTNPSYPELGRDASVAFHRAALERALTDDPRR